MSLTTAPPQHAFYLAPLRGITDQLFRRAYEEHFGCFDYMLAPFISTVRGTHVRRAHFRDTLPENSDTKRLIPQIIGNDSDGFLLLSRRFAELGFQSVNWNLGCPSPLITRKKRGSGLLPYKDEIRAFLDRTISRLSLPLSIKVRLGLESCTDLEKLIPILNDYPLKELIIHPRTGCQMYGGTVDLETFAICYDLCKHDVVYNGDIQSTNDMQCLSYRFPLITRWMIGRGVIKYPHLLPMLRGSTSRFTSDKIRIFMDDLFEANREFLPGPGSVLGKMKVIWSYLGDVLDKTGFFTTKILQIQSIDEYRSEVDEFFDSLSGVQISVPQDCINQDSVCTGF